MATITKNLTGQNEDSPPISNKVADVFNSIITKPLTNDKISEKLKKYLKPSNCNLVTKPVNLDIWNQVLSATHRTMDVKMQRIQNLIVKSTTSLLASTDAILKVKEDKTFDQKSIKTLINKVVQQNMDSLALLSTAHSSNEQIRRECLSKSFIKDEISTCL